MVVVLRLRAVVREERQVLVGRWKRAAAVRATRVRENRQVLRRLGAVLRRRHQQDRLRCLLLPLVNDLHRESKPRGYRVA